MTDQILDGIEETHIQALNDFERGLISYPAAFSIDDIWTVTVLQTIADRVHKLNHARGWWTDLTTGQPLQRNVGELLMLCVSELAEAMEGHRKSLDDDKLQQYLMFDVEIADCLIRLFDIIGGLGLMTPEAFVTKLHYNFSRPDHDPANRAKPDGKKY